MAQPSVQGRFIWEGLTAEDAGRAAAFYSKLLGWRTESWEVDSSYTIFSGARGPVAGVSQGTPGHWMSFIGADDVDASVAAAEKLGAKVQRPAADIPQTGRFSILTDPQGASFAVFKPLPTEAPPRTGDPQPGEIVWHELMTSDPEAALKFYQDLFGWQLITKLDMGGIGFYWIFGSNGVQLGGIFKPSHPMPGAAWLAYTSVADADRTAAAITQSGGRVCNGPMDVPGGGRIAQLADPSGVMFAVHSMKKAAAAPPAASKPPASKPAPKPAPKPAAKPAATQPQAAAKPAPASSAAPKPAAAAPAKPAQAPATAAPAKVAPKPAAAKKKAAPKKKTAPKKKKAASKKAKKAAKKAAPRRKKRTAAKRKSAAKRAPAARKVAKPAKRKKDKKKDKKSKKQRKRDKKKNKKGRRKK